MQANEDFSEACDLASWLCAGSIETLPWVVQLTIFAYGNSVDYTDSVLESMTEKVAAVAGVVPSQVVDLVKVVNGVVVLSFVIFVPTEQIAIATLEEVAPHVTTAAAVGDWLGVSVAEHQEDGRGGKVWRYQMKSDTLSKQADASAGIVTSAAVAAPGREGPDATPIPYPLGKARSWTEAREQRRKWYRSTHGDAQDEWRMGRGSVTALSNASSLVSTSNSSDTAMSYYEAMADLAKPHIVWLLPVLIFILFGCCVAWLCASHSRMGSAPKSLTQALNRGEDDDDEDGPASFFVRVDENEVARTKSRNPSYP